MLSSTLKRCAAGSLSHPTLKRSAVGSLSHPGTPVLVHGFDVNRIQTEIAQLWHLEESNRVSLSISNTTSDEVLSRYSTSRIWHPICKEMSSNMAGETGAVWIYKGALAACKIRSSMDAKVSEFALRHIQAEQQHLDVIQATLDLQQAVDEQELSAAGVTKKYTCLLPIWRVAGWTLGFLPTLLGRGPWLYHTVEAVETFVEGHYGSQIEYIKKHWGHVVNGSSTDPNELAEWRPSELLRFLTWACADEVEHRDDARRCLLESGVQEDTLAVKAWSKIVDAGSWTAAEIAKNI